MKIRLFWTVLAFVSVCAGLPAGPRDSQWKQVSEATNARLPKTAIERLEAIIAGAITDKAYAEAIKAIGRKVTLESEIQGDKEEEKVSRLQAELEKAPVEMKPVMEAILAHWYWQYFDQNRWQFMQRTQTDTAPGPDIQTWDLARILAEIDKHFTAALADEAALKATWVAQYDALLTRGEVSDLYRPTMYDFVANEALRFYQAGEQGALKAEDEFELDADASPIFGDVAEFVNWRPTATDDTSPALKAVCLYQNLLRFHQADVDRSAFHDVDLARLTFGKNKAVGENKDDRYKAALQRFIAATTAHEISARAIAALATQLHTEGELVEARALAQRGAAAFPVSAGGAMCSNLIHQIEAKSAQLETEAVWNAPWPTLDVTYRNVTKVFFRAIAVDFEKHAARNPAYLDEDERTKLLAAPPVLEWSAELPPTTDYQQRTEKLPAPTTLKPGFYFIFASHEPRFGTVENQLSSAGVWVSDLALVFQMREDKRPHTGLVLKAASGLPVEGATIRVWRRDRNNWREAGDRITTDENGRFAIARSEGPFVVHAEYGGQAISSRGIVFVHGGYEPDAADTRTVFFTDRALYRPGQTIQYKGISLRYKQKGAGEYSAIADLKLTVVFNDPNGKEVSRATHKTNDYGSFNGVFTAPRDRLMGRMTIQVLGRPSSTSVNVEEYKRPKFQVELAAPAEAAKLDAPVVLTGKATAYTGAAIGGAKVKWRVERGVRVPPWCWWWQPPATKAIAHGTVVTEPDGTFKMQFTAVPDRAVPVKNEPTFNYRIYADVTDTAGETRSADRTVNAGYTALQATLAANEWQTPESPVDFSIETKSLDGDAQAAEGTVTIYALKQPARVERAALQREHYGWSFGGEEPPADPANPDTWELGEVVAAHAFKTEAAGKVHMAVPLNAGIYRASLETKDRFGKNVTARRTVQVVDPGQRRYGVKLANCFLSPKWSVEPGEKFTVLWGTGYDAGRAFVELECDGKPLKSFWTSAERTQQLIEHAVTEPMRGGLTVRVTYVRENRAYFNERIVDVPWSDKKLDVKWESFRSKLMPGQKETWTAVVTGPDAEHASAELVATLYDASLDQYLPHDWPRGFPGFRREHTRTFTRFQNSAVNLDPFAGGWSVAQSAVKWDYREFTPGIVPGVEDKQVMHLDRFVASGEREGRTMRSAPAAMSLAPGAIPAQGGFREEANFAGLVSPSLPDVPPTPNLSKVTARKNLNETAFFFPQLLTDDDGVVKIQFTMPEALSEWKFLGFAHDKQLRSGLLTDKVVTAKDLMVEPNQPRFVREGDAIEFTVKVSNQTDVPQTGKVKLTFADAATQQSVDAALGNLATEQLFDVPAKQSRAYSWRIAVPDGMGFLTYKAVGATTKASDGEEGFLPVLSRRILVTESLPLPIRGKNTQSFEFKKLLESGRSKTLRSQTLTVQMTSQPAWYAVMALPYLMEYPYECSEQIFNRFYANALARHIATSSPEIRSIFDLWKATPALDSPLQKNQDLKSVMLEETPWLRQAKNESQARRNVGLLFDANRLDDEASRGLAKLAERQLGDGLWAWFPGGRSSEYISLYITTGFGRLRHLGAQIDVAPAVKSLAALDRGADRDYREILKGPHPENYVPGSLDALYLYGRSFFLEDQAIAVEHRTAVDFFLRQARMFWTKIDCRQTQAHLAIALQRFGDKDTPQAIMRSLKERSVSDEELGMFWRDTELSWWWYHAPIETQALMIEAFGEVAQDRQAVEDCKVWLLKQKQTQDWKTTKATADAIYALLLRGDNLLASDALVEVALAGQAIKPEKVEAGTGFYERTFVRDEIKPAMGQITVKKVDEGVSWGSVHWQYLEDMAKITPHTGTPLKLKKTLYIKETTGKGQVLKLVTGSVSVGDELVVRLELRTDRDMEYVHLKDQRGSGTEPVNVLSRYKYQDGLGYYESTRDTASHFFIDYLPKGVYVFEYSTRVQLRGRYQTGIAEIQCMYAPEFNSHSESAVLEIR